MIFHLSLMSSLNYKPCYAIQKYRYPIKKSDHRRAIVIIDMFQGMTTCVSLLDLSIKVPNPKFVEFIPCVYPILDPKILLKFER